MIFKAGKYGKLMSDKTFYNTHPHVYNSNDLWEGHDVYGVYLGRWGINIRV
jgi:hypothetical protein